MVNSSSFLIGCVGAIAPEILRLYKLRSSIRITWSWSYVLVSIPFILLGGFVAYILEPQNYYAAFYSGIGTPFIVNAIAKETQQAASTQDIPVVQDIPLDSGINSTPRGGDEYVAERGKGVGGSREKDVPVTSSTHKKKMDLNDFFRAL